MRAGGAGDSERVGALRVGERVVLENDALNVVIVVVVVDEQTGGECALSQSSWAETGDRVVPGDEDEASGRARAGWQRAGHQTDLPGQRRRKRRHQFNGHQRHPRLGQSRRRPHDRLQRPQPEQDRRGALIYLVHLHDKLGETPRPSHVYNRTAIYRRV